jgi:hypothetical protein
MGGGRIWGTVRLLLIVALVLLVWAGARKSHAWVASHPAYVVDPGFARVLAPAPWLTREDLDSIREDSGLVGRRYSFFTPGLADRFREGYAASPWVKSVTGVRLVYPNRVDVGLVVRRPVTGVPSGGRLVLVDASGIRLPGSRQGPPEGLAGTFYPLAGVSGPPPKAGEVWSGQVYEGVAVALSLADAPAGLLDDAGVVAVDVTNVGGRTTLAEPEVVLLTRAGVRIEWGRSKRSPLATLDPSDEDKFLRLSQALVAYPRLDGLAVVRLQFDALYTVPKKTGSQ